MMREESRAWCNVNHVSFKDIISKIMEYYVTYVTINNNRHKKFQYT